MLEASPCRLISCVSDDPDQPEFVWLDPERCLWGDPVMDFVTMGLGIWKLSEKTGGNGGLQ